MFSFLKYVFKLQFLVILLSILAGLYYPKIRIVFENWISDVFHLAKNFQSNESIPAKNFAGEKLFTSEELIKFNGEDENTLIYLSILGNVYDVSKGRKHYGTGCAYSMFAGRDASAHFITGDFEHYDEETSSDVLKLSNSDVYSLSNWKKFYDKEYTYLGKLIGRFYNEIGEKTQYHHKIDEILEIAEIEKVEQLEIKEKFPPCNIEWSEIKGTRVWCTSTSGGKDRNWTGWPRKHYETPGGTFRCACVRKEDLKLPQFSLYENCDQQALECFYKIEQ